MLPTALAVMMFVAGQPPAAAGPVFDVYTTGAKPLRGRLSKLAGGWAPTIAADDGKPVEVAAGALVGLRRADRPLPPWPAGPGVVMAGGDRIAGTVTGGDGRVVRFVTDYSRREKATEWSVPLSSVAAVWAAAPAPDTPVDPADYPWADAPGRRDAVLLRNGDIVRGTLEAFTGDPAGVRIKVGAEPQTLALTRVAAVAFDPSLARVRRPKGPFARLTVADGSRISLAEAASDGRRLTGKTPYGVAVDLPLADVIALDVLQGKAVYLSDLKPGRAVVEGYNSVAWPWAADRTVKRGPLRVGPHTFDKGLGTHPRTTLTYDLGGKYRRFEAVVGLDPVTGRRGAVDVRVLVDGKDRTVPGLAGLTASGSPKVLSLDVSGAKELTLVVDFGPAGDVQDDVNWGDARLVE